MGDVVEVFDNGLARVSLDGYPGFHLRRFHQIGILLDCKLRKTCDAR